MSNDRYERIRQALAMRPTPGPWEVINGTDVFTHLGARNAAGVEAAADDGWYIADCDMGPSFTREGREKLPYAEKRANAALIASCDPRTIWALLDERDGLAAEVERLRREAHPAITHCANCGCDWIDNGLNPIGCPYCKLSAETEVLLDALRQITEWPDGGNRYGQEKIKRFAQAAIDAAMSKEGKQ